jgi:shikimate kinase
LTPTARSPSNIVLIGMPGSGKSTIGVILAKMTSKDFIDTDILIQRSAGRSLQEIVDTRGHMALRGIEEEILLRLNCCNCVIATGGSAVYSAVAMDHLRTDGVVVFLDVDLATLRSRVHDYDTRGLAKRPDQTLDELFNERFSLYTEFADITLNCVGLSHEEVSGALLRELKARGMLFDCSHIPLSEV